MPGNTTRARQLCSLVTLISMCPGAAAAAISRAHFQDAFANQHVPTTPHSFLEQGRVIDWILTRGPIRANQPQVHRSVSASDHYPLSLP
jgi:endonuclease/exonuclease/phosphatase family metal-dependent hydrolase